MRTTISFPAFIAALLVASPVLAQVTPGEIVSTVSLPEGELENIKFDLAAYGQVALSQPVDTGWDDVNSNEVFDRYVYTEYGGEARVTVPVSPRITLGARGKYVHRDIRREITGTTEWSYGTPAIRPFYDDSVYEQERWEGNVVAQYHRTDRSEVVSISAGVGQETSSSYFIYSCGPSPFCSYSSSEKVVDLRIGAGYERQIATRLRLGGAANVAIPLSYRYSGCGYRCAPYPYNTTFSTSEKEYGVGAFGDYRLSDTISLRANVDGYRFRNGSVVIATGIQATFFNTFSIGPTASVRLRQPASYPGNANTTLDHIQDEASFFFGLQARVRIGGHI